MKRLGARFQQRRQQTGSLQQQLAGSSSSTAAAAAGGDSLSKGDNSPTAAAAATQQQQQQHARSVSPSCNRGAAAAAAATAAAAAAPYPYEAYHPSSGAPISPAAASTPSTAATAAWAAGAAEHRSPLRSPGAAAAAEAAAEAAAAAAAAPARPFNAAANGPAPTGLALAPAAATATPAAVASTSSTAAATDLSLQHPAFCLTRAVAAAATTTTTTAKAATEKEVLLARVVCCFVLRHAAQQEVAAAAAAADTLGSLPHKIVLQQPLSVAALPALIRTAAAAAAAAAPQQKRRLTQTSGAEVAAFVAQASCSCSSSSSSSSLCGLPAALPMMKVDGQGPLRAVSAVYPHRVAAFLLQLHANSSKSEQQQQQMLLQIQQSGTQATQQTRQLQHQQLYEQQQQMLMLHHQRKHHISQQPRVQQQQKQQQQGRLLEQQQQQEAELEALLSEPTAKNQTTHQLDSEVRALLSALTSKQQQLAAVFKTANGGNTFRALCAYGTREECCEALLQQGASPRDLRNQCDKLHFRKIIVEGLTDERLGDCSYLDTCRHIEKCRFVHYELEEKPNEEPLEPYSIGPQCLTEKYPAQWIRCDIRTFDFSIFKPFVDVVMADPPWDIHMDLPYGTMTDDEMRSLRVDLIQDEGLLFLWVTGRAMELARECLQLWGYRRVEEILWIKTNQLQRIIRTGRTGHWLNHSKEHCLVGVKGNPKVNRNIDCDVIVSEVRQTSRKPDEIYRIIERMRPGTLKVELFGRKNNIRNNWITLGNQLEGVKLEEPPELVQRYAAFIAANHHHHHQQQQQQQQQATETPDTRFTGDPSQSPQQQI